MPPKSNPGKSRKPAPPAKAAKPSKSKLSDQVPAAPVPYATIPERIVLFALVGTSPAVLTETLYALATQIPPVVPDEIVVVTTATGRRKLTEKLLVPPAPGAGTPYEHFRKALEKLGIDVAGRLAFGETSIHCIPSADRRTELDDVVSRAGNEALADFLLSELRRFTEDPGTRVIASIAGGRKTMSALLLSCMTLLARPRDSVCHVLVPPPYDDPRLSPPFLFPEKRLVHVLPGTDRKFPSDKARIDLIDVPFVKIRGWYLDRHGAPPPSYSKTVEYAQSLFPPATGGGAPTLKFDLRHGTLSADGTPIPLSPVHVLALCLFLHRKKLPAPPWEIMWQLHDNEDSDELDDIEWLRNFQKTARFGSGEDCNEDYRKVFSDLRGKLRANARIAPFADALVPRLSQYEDTAVWPSSRMSADIQFILRLLPKR